MDPTSDIGEDTKDDAPRCANCGERIIHEPTRRVLTSVENERVSADHLCDETCLAAFEG